MNWFHIGVDYQRCWKAFWNLRLFFVIPKWDFVFQKEAEKLKYEVSLWNIYIELWFLLSTSCGINNILCKRKWYCQRERKSRATVSLGLIQITNAMEDSTYGSPKSSICLISEVKRRQEKVNLKCLASSGIFTVLHNMCLWIFTTFR